MSSEFTLLLTQCSTGLGGSNLLLNSTSLARFRYSICHCEERSDVAILNNFYLSTLTFYFFIPPDNNSTNPLADF